MIKHLVKYEGSNAIKRANISNAPHLGYTSGQISELINVAQVYFECNLDAALYGSRPIDFGDRDHSRIIAMVCNEPPHGYYRWTLDLIVIEAQKRKLIDGTISYAQVCIILKEHNLAPWQENMWCIEVLSEDYIEKMEDVLNIYECVYDERRPVVCIDEKPVSLISDTRE